MWRDAIAWLFHSPRRLLLVIAVPLLVASLVPLASRFGGDDPSQVAATPAAPDGRAGNVPAPPEPVAPATAPPEAVTVVDRFVSVWLAGPTADTDEALRAWHRSLRAYVTPELGAALQDTDPSRVPEAKVTGQPTTVRVGDYLIEMSVPMSDGRDLSLTLAWDGRVWRVSDIEREGEP